MPHDPYKALYIHIPFCVKRCAYCDFITAETPRQSPEIDEYVSLVVDQIATKGNEGMLSSIETIYLGGGTPSFIGISRLCRIIEEIKNWVVIDETVEFTVEANPESFNKELVNGLKLLGVNRLSLGVQSFDTEVLRVLQRAHSSEQAQAAIDLALQYIDNVSIDLMCGIPGQSSSSFEASLQKAIDLGVKHVSVYPLTIEANTLFERKILSGEMRAPEEDHEAACMQLAASLLTKADFLRYEVANYAKQGYESKHNSTYWTGIPYLGVGRSAATMTQNKERRMRVQDGRVTDDLNPAQMAAEDLMLGMRLSCGVSEKQVDRAYTHLKDIYKTLQNLEQEGLITHSQKRWQPTEKGWLCGNELYGALYDLAP